MAGGFQGLRNGIGLFSIPDDIVLEGIVITHKFLWYSMGFHPFVIFLFHYDKIEVVGVGDSSSTEIGEIVETGGDDWENVGL